MKSLRTTALKIAGTLCLVLALVPSRASAQQGGGGGGRGGMGAGQQIQQVLKQLELTPDQQTKIQDIVTAAQKDMRESAQGLQNATQEERQAKMQELQKMAADMQTKVVAELTPEQKAKYFPAMANVALKRISDLVKAVKTAAGKQEGTDDQKKQLTSALDDAQKSVDGLKTEADAVTDADGATEFAKKVFKTQMDMRQQLVDILGQDDAQTLLQTARQSMGGATRRPAADAKPDAAPTTAPAPK